MTYQRTNPRELILDILTEILEHGSYSHLVLRSTLDKYAYLSKQDRAFITVIVEGTIERRITIDYVIDLFSKVKVVKMKTVIRNILRSAVYQMMYMDSVPSCAVVDESVKLAAKRGFGGLKGFVNGVLRSIDRGRGDIVWPDREDMMIQYVSVTYSLPVWIAELWIQRYGLETAESIAAAFLKRRETVVHVNRSRIDADEWSSHAEKSGIHACRSDYFPFAFTVSRYNTIPQVQGYREGDFWVQDTGSMLSAEAAMLRGNESCLDICAAPGGKSLQLAEALTSGKVISCDISEYKTALIVENAKRCGFSSITAVKQDAREYVKAYDQAFDVVLADLPCSGLGVLGRKADIKYRVTPDSLRELAKLQQEILSNAVSYVKPGGILIFSTCTISKDENESNAAFLSSLPEFDAVDLRGRLPERFLEEYKDFPGAEQGMRSGYIQLLPGVSNCDGFFMAVFKRRATE